MKLIRNFILLIILACVAVGIYGWVNYKKPKVTYANKIELIQLTDTNCRMHISVRIENENFFPIRAKDIAAELGNGAKGILQNESVFIPGNSDSVYSLNVNVSFKDLTELIEQFVSKKDTNTKRAVSFNAKLSFIPHYFHFEVPLIDTGKRDLSKFINELVSNNITLVSISKPDTFSLDSTKFTVDIKLSNPYPVPFVIKSYSILLENPSDSLFSLAELQSNAAISMQPNSEQVISNTLQVNASSAILGSLISYLENKSYNVRFNGTLRIKEHDFNISRRFLYKVFPD